VYPKVREFILNAQQANSSLASAKPALRKAAPSQARAAVKAKTATPTKAPRRAVKAKQA
jgi:hypothetical protein